MDYSKIDSISALLNRNDGTIISSGITVCSSEMPKTRLFLVGYIGYYQDYDMTNLFYIPGLDSQLKVTKITAKVGETIHTIMSSVRMATRDEKIEFGIKNKVGILECMKECVEILQRNRQGRSKDFIYKKLCSAGQTVHAERFSCEDDKLYYLPVPEDYILEQEDRKYVANNFYCLCRYTNPVTGVLSYNLFDPDNIILMSEKAETNDDSIIKLDR